MAQLTILFLVIHCFAYQFFNAQSFLTLATSLPASDGDDAAFRLLSFDTVLDGSGGFSWATRIASDDLAAWRTGLPPEVEKFENTGLATRAILPPLFCFIICCGFYSGPNDSLLPLDSTGVSKNALPISSVFLFIHVFSSLYRLDRTCSPLAIYS